MARSTRDPVTGQLEPQIDRGELQKMLINGVLPKECAKRFGVTRRAITWIIDNEFHYKKVLEIDEREAKAVAMLEKANKGVQKSLDAIDQLARINDTANQILDELVGENKTIDQMTDAIAEALAAKDLNLQRGVLKQLVKDISKNRGDAFKAMAEIRGQLGLQLEMLRTFNDLEATADFQRQVLEAIGEVAPDVRSKIISKLKERRTLRQSVRLV